MDARRSIDVMAEDLAALTDEVQLRLRRLYDESQL